MFSYNVFENYAISLTQNQLEQLRKVYSENEIEIIKTIIDKCEESRKYVLDLYSPRKLGQLDETSGLERNINFTD